ncbi:hypothetical protein ACH3VR_13365 [Microbacterium sp. B2969]|uniref:Adhesin domain-containing protein n=1 Tax=Microbacterium alkaliflavum TaxID=3248839 RepID=A0ABW7Q9G4_9MICO
MSTTMTPPPAGTDVPPPPGPPSWQPPAGPPTRGSSRVVAILLIVFGVFVVLGAVISAIFTTIAAASIHTTTRTVDVSGVDDLKVDVSAGSLRIVYADVSDAELEVTGTSGADRWTLDSSNDTLTVSTPSGWFSDGFWNGWIFGARSDAVLRLPQAMEGANADLSLAAGELNADGDFGDLQLDLGAGRATIAGSADSIDAQISAGTGELDLEGIDKAVLSVSAGSLTADFSGQQPSSVELDVSSGSARLTVPQGEYDVTSDVSAGQLDNKLGSVPGADSTIRVEVSAGQAVLRAG